MKFYIYLIGALFIVPAYALAANPSVQYFTPSSTTINSNQPVSFTWRIADGGGYSFNIPCVQGIKIFKADGTTFPCNTPITSVLTAVDGIDISVRNLTGSSKTITARLTPKDANSNNYPYGSQDIAITVAPITKPIESITGNTQSISSQLYTLSWSASQLAGVNLSISCSSIIRTTSPSYANGYLPCNTPIFANDLSPSTSLSLVFENNGTATSSITLMLLPAMDTGVYNGAGSETLTVDIVPNIIPDPNTVSFYTNTTLLKEGIPTSLFWKTEQSDGANLWFSCNAHITPIITIGTATSTPPCNALALSAALEASSTISVIFLNKSYTTEPITITVIPKSKKGGFDATRSKQIILSILPKGAVPLAIEPVQTPTVVVSTPQATTSTVKRFTKYLYRGISGKEVTLLQTYLKKDPSLYPEGIVSGYFGPATERAVKRFQEKYNIATISTPGYGGVGPKTRTLLNSLTQ